MLQKNITLIFNTLKVWNDIILQGTFDIADSSGMQDACHHELS